MTDVSEHRAGDRDIERLSPSQREHALVIGFGTGHSLVALARAAASPEMKRLTDDGALFIGRIKSYIIEEKQIIPRGE